MTDRKVLKMEVHQCFDTWSGTIRDERGSLVEVRELRGFAEEARNRW